MKVQLRSKSACCPLRQSWFEGWFLQDRNQETKRFWTDLVLTGLSQIKIEVVYHPSIIQTRLVPCRVLGFCWSQSQLPLGERQGYTLERSQVHHSFIPYLAEDKTQMIWAFFHLKKCLLLSRLLSYYYRTTVMYIRMWWLCNCIMVYWLSSSNLQACSYFFFPFLFFS